MWRDGGWRALNGVEEKKGLRFRTYVVPVRTHPRRARACQRIVSRCQNKRGLCAKVIRSERSRGAVVLRTNRDPKRVAGVCRVVPFWPGASVDDEGGRPAGGERFSYDRYRDQ